MVKHSYMLKDCNWTIMHLNFNPDVLSVYALPIQWVMSVVTSGISLLDSSIIDLNLIGTAIDYWYTINPNTQPSTILSNST